jgi:hypothetical protein
MLRLVHNAWIRFGAAVALGTVFALLAFQYHWFNALDLKVYDLGLSVRPALERPATCAWPRPSRREDSRSARAARRL